MNDPRPTTGLNRLIRFSLENKLIVALLVLLIIGAGVYVAPFDWDIGGLERNPVPVDAIPDIGENQQIVFTSWPGRSPQDMEDQISYPLTVALLGISNVKTVRSYSMFGFSMVYVIFDEAAEFYWSRTRILERLNSLPAGTLPDGIQPTLGPDATALGQVFWYTLEGVDEQGNPAGGWDLHELRSIQDFQVRYALMSAQGVSEVASVGGFVKEYQVDVDPFKLKAYHVTLEQVLQAVKLSNLDVGAGSIEVNRVEYVVRGVGFVKQLPDLENSVITVRNGTPVLVKHVATVTTGPAARRGALDKGGVEAVGGVVVVRYGENPLRTIKAVKKKIAEISGGLPQKELPDGTISQVRIVPFYDRTGLIYETLGTLSTALKHQVLITVIVVLLLVLNLRSSLIISSMLPLVILLVFGAMKIFGVDANIVALSGIAIAIGTIVDLGIVISENILRHLDEAPGDAKTLEVVYQATSEVSGAVVTAVATTVVSFLPVFAMQAAEGKLFRPLAFTKTFALVSAVFLALVIIPPLAHSLFTIRMPGKKIRKALYGALGLFGLVLLFIGPWWLGVILLVMSALHFIQTDWPHLWHPKFRLLPLGLISLAVLVLLAGDWLPLGPEKGVFGNVIFVGMIILFLMSVFYLFIRYYTRILGWALDNKVKFLLLPLLILMFGGLAWLGGPRLLGWLPAPIRTTRLYSGLIHTFPGMGREFMPPLDEGSFLFMPTTMPHASISEVLDVIQKQDMAINAIPEVSLAVGKIGRADSPLDPAPLSMIETVINYHSEFMVDEKERHNLYRFDADSIDSFRNPQGVALLAPDGEAYQVMGTFLRDSSGVLIPSRRGQPFRLWRPELDPALNPGREAWAGIQGPDDIWNAIISAAEIPGTTSAPKLQPIAARLVMLQSGMRAPMGIKIKGPDLKSIENLGLQLENQLKQVPGVNPATVFADRIVGKPYLEIHVDRLKMARYGLQMQPVQQAISAAIGGRVVTRTVEGRERYAVRVRYARELRNNFEALDNILLAGTGGVHIPLKQIASIKYVRGPQMIKSEDTFLVGYVIFDKKSGYAEVDVVDQAAEFLNLKIDSGELEVPPLVSYTFTGNYENQVRARKRMALILPLALLFIFLILYLQFRSVPLTFFVFSGVAVAWAGAFIWLWLYSRPGFLDISLFGMNLRELFHISPINLSVAVWVGFLALFGLATDDGVVIATYLRSHFKTVQPDSIEKIRETAIVAGQRRVRPAVMTTATTIIALLPILTATGRGADIMIPMAIPSFGGMVFEMITMLIVPVLYVWYRERKLLRQIEHS